MNYGNIQHLFPYRKQSFIDHVVRNSQRAFIWLNEDHYRITTRRVISSSITYKLLSQKYTSLTRKQPSKWKQDFLSHPLPRKWAPQSGLGNRFLDDGSTGNQCILDHCNNTAFYEVPVSFPCSFLNIVSIEDLRNETNFDLFPIEEHTYMSNESSVCSYWWKPASYFIF